MHYDAQNSWYLHKSRCDDRGCRFEIRLLLDFLWFWSNTAIPRMIPSIAKRIHFNRHFLIFFVCVCVSHSSAMILYHNSVCFCWHAGCNFKIDFEMETFAYITFTKVIKHKIDSETNDAHNIRCGWKRGRKAQSELHDWHRRCFHAYFCAWMWHSLATGLQSVFGWLIEFLDWWHKEFAFKTLTTKNGSRSECNYVMQFVAPTFDWNRYTVTIKKNESARHANVSFTLVFFFRHQVYCLTN